MSSAGQENHTVTPHIEAGYRVSAVWNGGFNGAITVTNTSKDWIDSWDLIVASDDLIIQNAWGMNATRIDADHIALSGADWGKSIGPWQSVTVGFTGAGTPPDDLDFLSDVTVAGNDVAALSPFGTGDYASALDLSMDFYYAQYSGDLPEDHPIGWRGDSALQDGADVGRDLTGGWYDAGDHVKFGLPMAYAATTLAWGAIGYAEGYRASDSDGDILAHISWVTDYLARTYDDKGTATLADDVVYVQVGNGDLDHADWGAAEDMTMARPTYAVSAQAPGTEVSAETAAALAAGAILLGQNGQNQRAAELLADARQLFAFSETYQGSYNDTVPEAAEFYKSWSGYKDELAWAATWLYEATGETEYLQKAQSYYAPSGMYWSFGWDDKSMGTAVRLAEFTGNDKYVSHLETYMSEWTAKLHRLEGTETNEGLVWLHEWGANRYAANTAFISMQFADVLDGQNKAEQADMTRAFAADQIDYLLGDNPDTFSYLIGFGEDFPENPHHRNASGHNWDTSLPNEHTLSGGLVGGPDKSGSYADDRWDYVRNEVSLDYNAGLSGALAGLAIGANTETDAVIDEAEDIGTPVGEAEAKDALIGEAGTVTFRQTDAKTWFRVDFTEALDDASVVMGPPTSDGSAPSTMRVRNIDETGFEFQLDEWDYLDGRHKTETVSWLAVESGVHTVNGQTLVAGSDATNGTLGTVAFGTAFDAAPTVLAQVASDTNSAAVTDRISNVTNASFDIRLQSQESKSGYGTENLSWIAVSQGNGADAEFLSGNTGKVVSNDIHKIDMPGFDPSSFAFLADMQTMDGSDPTTVRLGTMQDNRVSVFLEEERSSDWEVWHKPEDVGFVAVQTGLIFDDLAIV